MSERTNRAGALALASLIRRHRPAWPVHLVGFSGVLHLKTGMTQMADGRLLVSPAIQLEDPAPLRGMRLVEVTQDEAYAANVMPLGTTTLVPDGHPIIASLVAESGPVRTVAMDQFERMDGGLTCLSLRW